MVGIVLLRFPYLFPPWVCYSFSLSPNRRSYSKYLHKEGWKFWAQHCPNQMGTRCAVSTWQKHLATVLQGLTFLFLSFCSSFTHDVPTLSAPTKTSSWILSMSVCAVPMGPGRDGHDSTSWSGRWGCQEGWYLQEPLSAWTRVGIKSPNLHLIRTTPIKG